MPRRAERLFVMADAPVVHIGENSPEHVAYHLTRDVLLVIERKRMEQLSRKEYLDTYAECLNAVKFSHQRVSLKQ